MLWSVLSCGSTEMGGNATVGNAMNVAQKETGADTSAVTETNGQWGRLTQKQAKYTEWLHRMVRADKGR